MRAAVLNSSGFQLRDAEIPTPGAGEVLIKMIACGICGGDQHIFSIRDRLPEEETWLGHEGAGTIVSLGDGVSGFNVGDTVTSLSGGFSEYFISHADHACLVPKGIDPRLALGEPVACCVHASDRFGTKSGDHVAVVGCGFMGLLCMQLLKLQGAGKIVAIDPIAYRREAAIQLGADTAIAPEEVESFDPEQGIFDIVVEAAGIPSAIDLSTDLARQHGRVIFVGYHESNDGMRVVNMQRWNLKALDIVNGHVRRMDEKYDAMVKGVELIAQGKLHTKELVVEYPLDEISTAFDDIFGREKEIFKVVLVDGGAH
ncbi:MAG: zinc-binding dehydrogenase [Pseudomonadota bacterium]